MSEEKLQSIIDLLKSINAKLAANRIVEELKSEETEEIIMDLTDVTMIAHTDKAILVTKKGLQKWVPKSTIEGSVDGWEDGAYFEEVFLKDAGKWLNDKSWDKLKVAKK